MCTSRSTFERVADAGGMCHRDPEMRSQWYGTCTLYVRSHSRAVAMAGAGRDEAVSPSLADHGLHWLIGISGNAMISSSVLAVAVLVRAATK